MRVYRQVLPHNELSLFYKAFEKDDVASYFENEDSPSQVLLQDPSLSENVTVKIIRILPDQEFPLHRHCFQSLSLHLTPGSFGSPAPLIEFVRFDNSKSKPTSLNNFNSQKI